MASEDITKTETTKHIGKRQRLLDDPDIRRWHQGLGRSSPITADVRLRRLGLLCEQLSMSPKELIAKDGATITDILDDAVTMMDQKGYAPSYVKSTVTAAKSWLAHFGVQTTRRIRVRDADIAVTLKDEKVPERDELAELLLLGSLKARSIKQLLAKSGIRPGVVGNYKGTDGLRVGDLPDLALTTSGATFHRRPALVIVRAELSKTRKQYITLMTDSASVTVLAYLNYRMQHGETLGLDSPLITPNRNVVPRGFHPKPFLTAGQVGQLVRESIRPRFSLRPYALRAYFDTQLLQAESRGLVTPAFRAYWMGHKGSIDAVYTTNKRRLPETLVQEMREAFLRAEPYLDLEGHREDPEEKRRQQIQARVTQLAPDALGKVLELIDSISGNTQA